ncbi:MAG: carboxypeptidase-like regulatory domain-containing protein [Terracidiphilus sp.]
MSRRKIAACIIVVIAAAAVATAILVRAHHWRLRSLTIQGAVMRKDEDPQKELPIAGATVTASDGVTSISTQSDAAGYFEINFPEGVWPGQTLTISFQHADYQPFELKLTPGLRQASKELYVAAMTPSVQQVGVSPHTPVTTVSNIQVRYTVNTRTEVNVGSEVKTFEVANKGNVPCNGQAPCSPDGNWKAARGSVSLDAGPENEFRDARASCIAGPCAFTRIDSSGFVNGGRTITASALDWSDTATFLLEAEVFRTGMTSSVRLIHPVVFGQALHFTLPPTEEGVSLEADVNGTPIVFPLGPELYLSWATCTILNSTDAAKTQIYRCELKPGYRF